MAAGLDGAFAEGPGEAHGFPLGCPVLDRDGERVGALEGADGGRLVVRHLLLLEDLAPLWAVAGFDGEAVRLNVGVGEVRRGLPDRPGDADG